MCFLCNVKFCLDKNADVKIKETALGYKMSDIHFVKIKGKTNIELRNLKSNRIGASEHRYIPTFCHGNYEFTWF